MWFALILGAYLLGSVPASYLAAKLSRGIDLRQYGTGQLGGGNLWRMTSWRLGLPVGIFDVSKGLIMVWVAKLTGLDVAQQLAVGSTAIVGHNWPVFLRFSGGRGIGTTMGILLILPLINDMTPWASIAFFAILLIGFTILRSSPVPAVVGTMALPLVSWGFHEPLSVTLGFLAIFLIIVIKRLTAPQSAEAVPTSKRQLLLNRLLFDRDIKDRKGWMYRKPAGNSITEQHEP
ncbi:glycerol-3-phosphate acyltransferase [Chloroflexota bacterium]